jgi:iron complex outermembrane recepter protein
MQKTTVISAVCALAISTYASELGTIKVESSTIDNKYNTKKTEVSNITTITAEEIEKINPTNVEDVLKTIPGITASNVGNDRVKIHIRGVDNHRYMGEKPGVAVVIDGVPVQETTGKINLDLDNIASIKVIKGGASYLYGNDAIAGAIVITTKRPKGKSTSKVETEVGSFGFRRALVGTNQGFENSSLQLQGTLRQSDGYWDDAYLDHKSINGKYQYYLSDTSDLTFGLDYTQKESGDGTSVHGIDEARNDPESKNDISYAGYYDAKLFKTFLTYSNDLSDTSNLMLNVSRYQDDTTSTSSPTDDNQHKSYNDETWIQNTFKAEYRKSFDSFALMGGVDLARNSQENHSKANITYESGYGSHTTTVNKGDIKGDSDTKEDINALYLELQYQITSNFSSTFNYRYDHLEYEYENHLDNSLNVDPSYDVNSYRAGLSYKINDNNYLFTSFATGFRAPTARQISGNQDGIAEYPDADIPSSLDPEKTYNYELGIRGKINSFNYEAAVYQIDRLDYLGKKAGTYTWSGLEDEDSYTFNMGDLQSRGVELSLNSHLSEHYFFTLAYTYLDSTFQKFDTVYKTANGSGYGPSATPATYERISLKGNRVPRTSKHTLNLNVDIKFNDSFTLSPEIVSRSSYYADEMNKFKQGGYTVVNVRSNYKYSDSLEIFAKIDNFFNKNYYNFVNVGSTSFESSMNDATIRVAPPMAFYGGLRYKF